MNVILIVISSILLIVIIGDCNGNRIIENLKLSNQTLLETSGKILKARSLPSYDRQVYLNGVVELTCELSNYYGNNVKWRKLRGRLSDDSIERDGKLSINYVRQEDSGEYECYTLDGRSSVVRLDVLSYLVNSDNLIVFGETDSNVHLKCHLDEKNEKDIRWRRIDGKMSEYSRDYGSYLLIYYLNDEDSGYYECYTRDGHSSRTRLIVTSHDSNVINIPYNEQNLFRIPETTTTLSYDHYQSRSHVVTDIDSNIELNCDLEIEDEFEIKWKRLNGEFSHYTREYGRRLFIYYIKMEDAGEYECYLDDGRSNLIRLTVRSKSENGEEYQQHHTTEAITTTTEIALLEHRNYHYVVQNNLEKEVDESIQLECRLGTYDESQIKWRRVNGEFSYYTREHGRILYVYYLTEQDSGSYECSLPNGQIERFNLIVRRKDEHTTTISTTTEELNRNFLRRGDISIDENEKMIYEKDVDSNVEMSCNLYFVKNNNYIKWRRHDGARLSENSRQYGGKLLIYYLREEDSGDYECYTPDGNSNHVRLIVNINYQPNIYHQFFFNDHRNYISSNNKNNNNHLSDDLIQLVTSIDKDLIELKSDNQYPVENICTGLTNSHNLKIEWYDPHGNLLKNNDNLRIITETKESKPLKVTSKLLIYNPYSDYGTYECRLTAGISKRESKRFELRRESLFYEQRAYRQICNENQATCSNGQCISRSGLCDGRADCSDGSDENNCGARTGGEGYSGPCQPNERPCHNNKCIQKIWFCDGEKDCEDGSDELSCAPKKAGHLCKSYEFMCKSRNQCILKSFQCDREFDCTDKSDEIGCEVPRVVKNPIRNLTVRLGGTFKIDCIAEGFPVPYINWRLNWGHTCEEPRCYATNDNGHGVFTVTNTQFSDQGAYSCEAINSEGRVFAVPDSIVYVIIPATLPPPPPPIASDCMCHNHSDECTCSGRCLNCQHNTEGDRCQYCKPGFYGDAKRGTPYDCYLYSTTTKRTTTTRPPPLPIVDDACQCNNHSIDCTCSGFCLNCQHNTRGNKCQYCIDGYVGDATKGTPYDCVPAGELQYLNKPKCNPHGTSKIMGDTCRCKYGVTGRYCDQCATGSFNLITNRDYRRGCLPCFCNGLDVYCSSSRQFYGKIEADFYREGESWIISDRFTRMNENLEIINNNAIEFTRFNQFKDYELYLLVPSKFKGNKLSSYGGNITITFRFDVDEYYISKRYQKEPVEVRNLDLRISGSRVNIYYYHTGVIQAKTNNRIVIPLIEENFMRYGDDAKVDREHMLMALSDIEAIMIRASYVPSQTSIILSEFTMDSADFDNQHVTNKRSTPKVQASSVEVCQCPTGYTGLSCESCAYGYKRSNRGFYLGLCEKIGYF